MRTQSHVCEILFVRSALIGLHRSVQNSFLWNTFLWNIIMLALDHTEICLCLVIYSLALTGSAKYFNN